VELIGDVHQKILKLNVHHVSWL